MTVVSISIDRGNRTKAIESIAAVRGELGRDFADLFDLCEQVDLQKVNRKVFEDSKAAGLWVNVADDPPHCTFHVPAKMRRGPLQIAIASDGDAPFVTRRVRQLLERRIGPEWAEWMEAAALYRDDVRRLPGSAADRELRYDAFFTNTVDRARFRVRVPSAEEKAA